MRETGEVTKTEKNFATVKIDRKSECEKCGMCGMKKGMSFVEVNSTNDLGAKVGDKVIVETGGGVKFLAVVFVFLIPLILLAATIILGYAFIKNEIYILALCLGTLIVWYTILSLIDKKFAKLKGFCPEIIQVIGERETNE